MLERLRDFRANFSVETNSKIQNKNLTLKKLKKQKKEKCQNVNVRSKDVNGPNDLQRKDHFIWRFWAQFDQSRKARKVDGNRCQIEQYWRKYPRLQSKLILFQIKNPFLILPFFRLSETMNGQI